MANPGQELPNIIFFLNHTDKASWKDLWYSVTGRTAPPGKTDQSRYSSPSRKKAQKSDLSVIDYIIWAETFESTVFYVINERSIFSEGLKRSISSAAHETIDIKSV